MSDQLHNRVCRPITVRHTRSRDELPDTTCNLLDMDDPNISTAKISSEPMLNVEPIFLVRGIERIPLKHF